MVIATKIGSDILSQVASLLPIWVKIIELESVIAVWPSVAALEITHAQLAV